MAYNKFKGPKIELIVASICSADLNATYQQSRRILYRSRQLGHKKMAIKFLKGLIFSYQSDAISSRS